MLLSPGGLRDRPVAELGAVYESGFRVFGEEDHAALQVQEVCELDEAQRPAARQHLGRDQQTDGAGAERRLQDKSCGRLTGLRPPLRAGPRSPRTPFIAAGHEAHIRGPGKVAAFQALSFRFEKSDCVGRDAVRALDYSKDELQQRLRQCLRGSERPAALTTLANLQVLMPNGR